MLNNKIFLRILPLILLFLISAIEISARQDSVEVTIVDEYKAGSFHRFFFGDTWRDLWATPMKIPVLNLQSYAGGLTPIKKGGGMTTRSLKFKSKDGKIYKFRSVRKFTEVYLPNQLQNSLVEEAFFDVFSTINPLSAIISAPIINSVGVLQAQPELYVMPDDPLLGEYREYFKNLPGTIELHPDDWDESDSENFADADKVFGSYKLFNKFKKKNSFRIDANEYLKARLLDIYMGDWDRHYDQWRWAQFDLPDKKKIARPIPRDRDQAFCSYDGLIPWIATLAIPQIEHCDEDYPLINDLTWSGRYLDRKFLPTITRHTWDSITNFVYQCITDSVIDYSLSLLPKEVYGRDGKRLKKIMVSRREGLKEASDDFYFEIIKYVDLWCSDDDEYVKIYRNDDGSVDISIFDGKKADSPFMQRKYYPDETADIRIYLFDGDDEVDIKGKTDNSIRVRLIGGDGKDKFDDDSRVSDFFDKDFTLIYDDGDKTKVKDGDDSYFDDTKYPEPENDTLLFELPVRDWGHDWKPAYWFGVNSDDLLFFGGGPILIRHDFRMDPYYYMMWLKAGYSVGLQGFRAEYFLEMPVRYSNSALQYRFYTSSLDVVRFHGIGNETKLKNDVDKDEYYEVYLQLFDFDFAYKTELSERTTLKLNANLRIADNDTEKDTYFNENPQFGDENLRLFNLGIDFNYDSRDNQMAAREGLYLDCRIKYSPEFINRQKFFENSAHFFKAEIDMRTYFTSHFVTDLTYAARIGGAVSAGDIPFFELPFIGDYNTIRGYGRQRYSGDASVFANFEARMKAGSYNILIPGEYGILGMADVGRVFIENGTSKKWHPAFGAGIWANFVYPEYVGSVYICRSPEITSFYINAGFMF